ncbi:hypothetical protein HQQ80_17105 [Microbacteriaceae bacterium VKM Ac-2855]|nr:hypothetical protein [Microbacteriaceae bacterium VKM Ac-2855]
MTTESPNPDAPKHLRADTAERVSAAAYGAIVAASTLAGTDGHTNVWSVVALVFATNLVYWATHVFAYTLGDRSSADTGIRAVVLHHMRVSGPIVSSAFLPIVVVLILGAFGLDRATSSGWGMATAALTLVTVAVSGGYLRGARGLWLALIAAGTILLAGILLAAKLLLH